MAIKLTIIIEKSEEGSYTAHIKEFPGAIGQDDAIGQTVLNALDALQDVMDYEVREALKKYVDLGDLMEEDKDRTEELDAALLAYFDAQELKDDLEYIP